MEPVNVVVTGLGLMTGVGLDLESSWQGLVAGRRVARRYTLFDTAGVDVPVGVELPDGADDLFRAQIKPRSRAQMTRGTMISLVTARMALDDAGLDLDAVDRQRVGVVAGATGTGYVPPPAGPDANRILKNMASAPAAWISLKERALGPSMVVSTACSSGVYALHTAWHLIVSGECDVVVAGAGDSSLNAPDSNGFAALMALADADDDPARMSRPFDATRKGFVMGEGGGFLVLESAAHAAARGARVHAALHRPGLASEGYNIVSPEPGGGGMARTMRLALAAAGLRPEDIGYVNAHGTSTPLNDLYETAAIRDVFGDCALRVPVSSTKGVTGHCLAAAGGVEAVIAVLALARGVLPPTVNLAHPDPELGPMDFVADGARTARIDHAMCNSFAFGGQNAVCIFSRP
jgi:3-oxoacyl-[acyl-carrier-protein] synthase II